MTRVNFEALWVEKYRPRELKEMVLPEDMRRFFAGIIKSGDMPHLLLAGSVGSGKTTISRILLDKLDAQSLILNASDERGIDTMRTRIKRFAQTVARARWKVVFMDEADALTPDAQNALRNIMETYAAKTRFILTANYSNRIIQAIHSRCQTKVFRELGRKAVLKLVSGILKNEKVSFEVDTLLAIVDDFYPDVRSIINQSQCLSSSGALRYEERLGTYQKLVAALAAEKKSFAEVRKIIQGSIDYVGAMRYLFDHVTDFASSPAKACVTIAEYMYRDAFMPDREIGFAALCLELMGQ